MQKGIIAQKARMQKNVFMMLFRATLAFEVLGSKTMLPTPPYRRTTYSIRF